MSSNTPSDPTEGYPLFVCGFCLYEEKHWYFETKLKNGKPSLMLECPECHLKFRRSSLIRSSELTADAYARWIVNYPFQDFWHRIDFDFWKKRIAASMGGNIGYFWERYHYWKNERAVVARPVEFDKVWSNLAGAWVDKVDFNSEYAAYNADMERERLKSKLEAEKSRQ